MIAPEKVPGVEAARKVGDMRVKGPTWSDYYYRVLTYKI